MRVFGIDGPGKVTHLPGIAQGGYSRLFWQRSHMTPVLENAGGQELIAPQ